METIQDMEENRKLSKGFVIGMNIQGIASLIFIHYHVAPLQISTIIAIITILILFPILLYQIQATKLKKLKKLKRR